MNIRAWVTVTIAVLGLATGPAAAADKPKPVRPSAGAATTTLTFESLPEPFRGFLERYAKGDWTRSKTIKAINLEFAEAIKRAQAEYKAALSNSKIAPAKTAADATRKAAISTATTSRQRAVDLVSALDAQS